MNWRTPLRPALNVSEGLLDRVLCVLGAVCFSQAPEFMQQYLQRLGGHLDEARRQLAQFSQVAAQSGLTLDELITKTSAQADAAVARLGLVIHGATERVHSLSAAEAALREASFWERPWVFLAHFDPAIAQATWAIYKPAVPTTFEGLVYAALGVVLALGLYYGLVKAPTRWLLQRCRQRKIALAPVPQP